VAQTSSIGRPAVPLGSPSSTAADWPPASSAQQTWAAPGCSARSAATTFCAPARSGIGWTQAMKRLFLMISSWWTGARMVWGMGDKAQSINGKQKRQPGGWRFRLNLW
jgi:hypothetical protein